MSDIVAVLTAITSFLFGASVFIRKFYPALKSQFEAMSEAFNNLKSIKKTVEKDQETSLDDRISYLENDIKAIKNELIPKDNMSLRELAVSSLHLATISEERSKYLLESHAVPTYECDPVTGNCTWVNESLSVLFGLSQKTMLGRGWLAALDPLESQECWEHFQKAIKIDIPYTWTYTVINQVTGEKIVCKTTATTIRNQNHHPILLRGIVTELNRYLE